MHLTLTRNIQFFICHNIIFSYNVFFKTNLKVILYNLINNRRQKLCTGGIIVIIYFKEDIIILHIES